MLNIKTFYAYVSKRIFEDLVVHSLIQANNVRKEAEGSLPLLDVDNYLSLTT